MRLLTLLLVLVAAAAQEVVFRTETTLVVTDVTVRDRSGKEISGLKKEDFVVLEDGKPQAIAVFEYQRIASAEPAAPAAATPVTVPVQAGKQQIISTAQPGRIRYQDRRLLVMFFDFSAMPPADQHRANKAALEFIDTRMGPSDLVSIMTFGAALKVEQDFTDDRERLKAVVNGFIIGQSSELATQSEDAETGEETNAAFEGDDTEFNIFNTDRKLYALESAARMLAALPERKALVYFSSGVSKTGSENQSQLRSTVNAAVRANVSFYPVDTRGLVASVPGGDASKGASRGTSMFSGQAQTQQRERFNDQQETLSTLAADTGGKAFLDSNDLSLGIVQAQQDIRSYYVIGYYSSNPSRDGRFRRVQVKVTGQQQAKLDYRSGYFAPKEFGKFTDADKESQLQDALMLGDPVTDLPLALEASYFRLNRQKYFVPIAMKIPGSTVQLARKGSAGTTEFDFIGQVRDLKGRITGSVRDGIKVKLSEDEAEQLNKRHLQYDTGFTLSPGDYRLKFLVRENQTGKMGTFETSLHIPDLDAQTQDLRVSSVVLSNQREKLDAAIGGASNSRKVLAANPLVQDGQKLVPSITRVFRRDQNLYVYLETYGAAVDAAGAPPSISATLAFYRGRRKAFESAPVQVHAVIRNRAQAVPLQFQVPLAKMPPGNYVCQVNVIDEIGRKFAFPRASMVVLP